MLAFAGDATACVSANATLRERFDHADAAIVGRVVAETKGEVKGAPVRLLTVEVDEHIKGDLGDSIVVRSPSGSDCDLLTSMNAPVGLLLTRAPDGAWLGTARSVVAPGPLIAEGGEPRGGAIKVVVGLVVLTLVLLWAFYRLRKGTRPDLPGAPRP